MDDSLIEDAEKVDPAISKLPPHKVDKDQLKKETTLSHDATFDDKELVASMTEKFGRKKLMIITNNMVSPIKQILDKFDATKDLLFDYKVACAQT